MIVTLTCASLSPRNYNFIMTKNIILIIVFTFYFKLACTKPLIIQSVFCVISSMAAINQQEIMGLIIDVSIDVNVDPENTRC